MSEKVDRQLLFKGINTYTESIQRKFRGRGFHSLVATTSKTQSLLVLSLERGTDKQNQTKQIQRTSISWPCKALNIVTRILNWIRLIGFQSKDRRIGVTWHHLAGLVRSLAAAFLGHLQTVYGGLAEAGKKWITVIKTGGNKSLYDNLQLSPWHNELK